MNKSIGGVPPLRCFWGFLKTATTFNMPIIRVLRTLPNH